MQARAMDNLRYIRGMMERAATFTAVSGWGEVVIGVTAIVAALVAARQTLPWAWVATWLAEAGIAAGISVSSMALKAHAANMPLLSGPLRKLVLSFSPSMIAGAVLTIVFVRHASYAWLPGIWMLLYGAAVVERWHVLRAKRSGHGCGVHDSGRHRAGRAAVLDDAPAHRRLRLPAHLVRTLDCAEARWLNRSVGVAPTNSPKSLPDPCARCAGVRPQKVHSHSIG
jgi:hypothetical protein